MSTKNDILKLLQRETLTVNQLCERLGITRNAINVQIRQLEAEGLVRRQKTLERGGAGKPAAVFEAAAGAEDINSGAYPVFLKALLTTLGDSCAKDVLSDLLEKTGRQMAHAAGLASPTDFESGLRAAMAAADALGASTEAIKHPEGIMVRNYSCPIGSAVRQEPCGCKALAAFFSEATGMPAQEHCLRDGKLICQYLIQIKNL
ncbi:helix-turn-helix transcriptional regulator [Pseudomonas citri]|uniref:helix-turn-helix transcriptional regulator n=1 Tax=Pseudomonas citri TaxID=2978349 RepID=UPI0021B5E051|nr:ArsR family transcriptional regulator [Pseudomonas citri]